MSAVAVTANEWVSNGAHFVTQAGRRVFFHRTGTGPAVLLLHGFPTWSYDYAEATQYLKDGFDVVAPDFLGYGFSEKPLDHDYSVPESADMIEELVAHLGLTAAHLVMYDYGAIVGQELLDRRRRRRIGFNIGSVVVMNCAVPYEQLRPTWMMKMIMHPVFGGFVSARISKEKTRLRLNAGRGVSKLDKANFDELWSGMARGEGHKQSHRLMRYNRERDEHASRWEDALFSFEGPLQLIWGMDDPVSGAHVLAAARPKAVNAEIIELPGVGHFPSAEAPRKVAEAIRSFLL